MGKVRILHLLRSNLYSGAENVVCQIIEMFKDSNFDMAYCSEDGQIKEILQNRNIKFFALKSFSYVNIKKVVKNFNPDIIHSHDAKASVLSSFLLKPKNKISHLHSNNLWMGKFGVHSLVYYLISGRFSKILTVSDSIMDEYVFGKNLLSKSEKIGNPINISSIQKYKQNDGNRIYDIAFCGRFEHPKDPMRFITIVENLRKKLPNLSAVMIGKGSKWKACKKYINNKSLEKNIELTGFLENPYDKLSKAKILCMPSVFEGYGLAAIEALALGCPVVCTSVGGLPKIVNEQCGRLCDTDEDFENELNKLITNPKHLQKKSDGAISKAYMLDNIKNYKEALEKIYIKQMDGFINERTFSSKYDG